MIDIGKQKWKASIKDDEGNVLCKCTFLNNKDGIRNSIEELINDVWDTNVRAVKESKGTI